MGNPVVHFELWSQDPQKCSDFYTQVFAWKIENIPAMNYHLVQAGDGGGIGGGIMKPQKGPWPCNMTFYIDVEDLGTYRQKITAAGGKILIEEMAVPGIGSFSLFEDPEGRVLGLWKQNK